MLFIFEGGKGTDTGIKPKQQNPPEFQVFIAKIVCFEFNKDPYDTLIKGERLGERQGPQYISLYFGGSETNHHTAITR